MNAARLFFRDFSRNPLRTLLTISANTVGVIAFIFLQTVIQLWYSGVAVSQPDRLIIRNKISFTQQLPLSYLQRIKSVQGVDSVTYAGWFGGRISERANDFFPSVFVDTATYLTVFNEFIAPEEQIRAWQTDPCGAAIGTALANRFGWRPGDRVTLKGEIYPGDWTFNIRAIYSGNRPEVDTTVMAIGFQCINEKLSKDRKNFVGYYAARIDDPSRSSQVTATIDRIFANSPYETKTESERAFQLGFVAMSGAIIDAIRIVSYVVLAIILLVVGNTLAMGVRERTTEIATMRALGFRRRQILLFEMSSSATISAISTLLGSLLSPVVVRAFTKEVSKNFALISEVSISNETLLLGASVSLLVGIVAGLLPALHAIKLPIAEGLRKTA